MIIRFWLLAGILLVALAWVLMVPLSPPSYQASPRSTVADYRASGVIPQVGEATISDAVGHDVFEIPETDAAHALEETAAGAMPDMAGDADAPMTEPGTDDGGHGADAGVAGTMPEAPGMADMPGMDTMPESGGADAPMAEPGTNDAGMADMPGMATMPESGGATESEGDHGGSQAGIRVLDGMMAGMAGRTVEIEMREWSFSPPGITVATGEVVRLTVRNAGNVPHEFMIMPPQGMAAVAYRLERADWNLTEHEAIFERQMVMPGDSFEVVIQADRPGNWMYMCMFPFHMQFGMMGSLVTEGTAPMEGMKM